MVILRWLDSCFDCAFRSHAIQVYRRGSFHKSLKNSTGNNIGNTLRQVSETRAKMGAKWSPKSSKIEEKRCPKRVLEEGIKNDAKIHENIDTAGIENLDFCCYLQCFVHFAITPKCSEKVAKIASKWRSKWYPNL